MMGWTQPICTGCWYKRHPGVEPIQMAQPVSERCAFCDGVTQSGIYTRADPSKVPFPRKDDDE